MPVRLAKEPCDVPGLLAHLNGQSGFSLLSCAALAARDTASSRRAPLSQRQTTRCAVQTPSVDVFTQTFTHVCVRPSSRQSSIEPPWPAWAIAAELTLPMAKRATTRQNTRFMIESAFLSQSFLV